MAFLDISKTNDNVPREIRWIKIEEGGDDIIVALVPILKELFEQNTTRLVSNGKYTEPMWWSKGLAQGSKLSPHLFNLCIDDLAKSVKSKCGSKDIICLLYSDDICIITKRKMRRRFKRRMRTREQINQI